VEFYTSLARESGGPVLELACGTGRVLLEIARLGMPCTGLDASEAMLSALRAKSPPASLRLVRAPMQRFAIGERFALIYSAFRAFQHLVEVEDQLGCLRCVREHLAPGGHFAFDVFCPRMGRTALEEEPWTEDHRFQLDGDRVVRLSRVRRDIARQCMTVDMRYVRSRDGRPIAEDEVTFQMRWFWRYELEHLLARAGFSRVEIFGDFQRSPVRADSPAFVVLARSTS
jgi:SAM-dependent methyltransferase